MTNEKPQPSDNDLTNVDLQGDTTLHPLASNIVKIDVYKLPMQMLFHLTTELANRPGIKSDILSYSAYISNDCPADIKAVILVDNNNPNVTIFAAYRIDNQSAIMLNFVVVPMAVDLVNGVFKWDTSGLWYNKELVLRVAYKNPPVQQFTPVQPRYPQPEYPSQPGYPQQPSPMAAWGTTDPKFFHQSPNLNRWGGAPEQPETTPINNLLFTSTQSASEVIFNMSTLGLVLVHKDPTRLIFGKPMAAGGYQQPGYPQPFNDSYRWSRPNQQPAAPTNIIVTLV